MAVLKNRNVNEGAEAYLVSEVAAKLRLAISTVYAKARRGEIAGAFRSGRTVRVNRDIFNKWYSQGKEKAG